MYQLPLWGYLPCYFLTGIWGLYLLLRARAYMGDPDRERWFWMSTLSGLLLAMGFPVIPLTPLLFVAWIPLLMVEYEISESGRPKPRREWLKYSYHTLLTWNLLTTWWVSNASLAAGFLAIILNALLMSIAFTLFYWVKKHLPTRSLAYLALAAFWMGFEYIHLRWDLSWPWLTLGNSFMGQPALVQWYEYTGVFGGSLWIWAMNLLILPLALKYYYGGKKPALRQWTTPLLVMLLPVAFSLLRYYTYAEKSAGEAETVIVQPNYEPHYEKFDTPEYLQIQRYFSLSQSKLTPNTGYLVYPETSFRSVEERHFQQQGTITTLEQFISRYPKLHLLTGLDSHVIFEPGEPHEFSAIRTHVRAPGDTLYWEAYNTAIQISNDSDTIPVYHKSKLVPGPELLPYKEYLFFLQPIFDEMGGTVAGLGRQPDREVFYGGAFGMAPVICYESIYGAYVGDYIRKGASAIAVMTNDGWWDDTPGYQQHLRFSSLRAIETRRDVVRSANSGTSCFVNQRGDILQPTRYAVQAAIRGTVHFNDQITFYTRWGDLIGLLALCAAVAFLIWGFWNKFYLQ